MIIVTVRVLQVLFASHYTAGLSVLSLSSQGHLEILTMLD